MSIISIIFLSLFNTLLSLPSPLKINSFTPFYITSNEVLFEFGYNSEKKTDIITIFKSYSSEPVLGKMYFSSNLTNLESEKKTKIFIKELMFDEPYSIVINSSNIYNEGKKNYYIYLVGNLDCSFEIFLSNEIKNLNINEFYFYSYFSEYSSQNYFTFKIENLTENIYMNILLFNKTCSAIEIKKKGNIIKCDKEIKNELLLEKNYDYSIKYNLDILNYISISFQKDLTHSLDDKSHSFIPISNFIFNFSINIKNYKTEDYFGFVIDQPVKCSLEGDFSSENNFNENFKPKIKSIVYHYFITKKGINNFNYFNGKIKFYNNYFNKKTIFKLDIIYFIDKLPFSYNIKKDKSYLFLFSNNLIKFYKNYNSYIKIGFENENSMNIILIKDNKIIKDRVFISKIKEIDAISFIKLSKEGLFEVSMLSENYNQIINSNYFMIESEKTDLYIENNIGEKIELIPFGNRKIFFFNLLSGSIDIYEIKDVNKKEESILLNKNNSFKGIIKVKNQTKILKFNINSYSFYELFYQNYEKNHHFIGKNSKILYFSKYIKYTIFNAYNDTKIGIKLLSPDSELTLKCYYQTFNNDFIKLTQENIFIEVQNMNEIEIEGNNTLVYFLIPLTNNSNYIISYSNNDTYENINEIFIVPEKTDHDMINLFIKIDESNDDNDNISLLYYVDYNIIPYSRNKKDLMKKIILKKGVKDSISIHNFLKKDNSKHSNNETLYIFLFCKKNISLTYEIKYSDFKILNENGQILIPSGQNKIYIGYEKNNYLKFDNCGNHQISLDLYQNDEISRSNIKITNNDLISCSNNNENGFLSLEANSKEDFLISLSHKNYSAFDNIIYNYDIQLSMDKNKRNVIINFYPISNYPQVEYHIFLRDKKYYANLTNHCFINKNINNIYVKKYMILSNGEEEIFNEKLNIKSNIICNETYSFLILGKEVINEYINYHYYNPNNFILNVIMEVILMMKKK